MAKIVVPEGMWEAFICRETHIGPPWDREALRKMLCAAIEWLSENPIVPSVAQAREVIGPIRVMNETSLIMAIEAWQRRMFIREPELPPEIERLIRQSVSPIHEKTIREAYELGRKSVSK